MKFDYDPEADVLAISLSKKPFAYAHEAGDFVVHFDKNDKPVYVEVLNAKNFILSAAKIFPKSLQRQFPRHIQTA